MMQKRFLILGCLMAIFSVMIGAFAAHGLKPQLTEYQIGIFDTGVEYQFYHSFAILTLGLLANQVPTKWINRAGWLFVLGILCFSGSLYLLACKDILGISAKILGPITPLGGTFFIIGWAVLMVGILKSKIGEAK